MKQSVANLWHSLC